jgi:preprotein translocase subunit SecE
MVEKVKKQSRMKSWWAGLKAEFSKIIWPTKATIVKQTIVVVIITIIVGFLISIIDNIVQFGLDKIIG